MNHGQLKLVLKKQISELCGVSLSSHSSKFTQRFMWFTVILLGRIFTNFRPKEYNFDLHKGFFTKELAQICQISREKIPNRQITISSNE
jgi:hypothetical protein